MKVIHLSTGGANYGGAGKAAMRINNALRSIGCDSNVVILMGTDGIEIPKGFSRFISKIANKILIKLLRPDRFLSLDILVNRKDIIKLISDADIIHLHWLNNGIWSSGLLNSIKKVPIVWTMHDMWPFTGACHYADKCRGYLQGCKDCVALKSKWGKAFCEHSYQDKIRALSDCNVQMVGCSNWITNEATKSSLAKSLKHSPICIPNPINDKIYRPISKDEAKSYLGINTTKKIICFGAMNSTGDKRKGYIYLVEAVKKLDPSQFLLLIFGNGRTCPELSSFETVVQGYVTDETRMAHIYNAADVFVAPSLEENLANTVMESLSCGTPVVAFNIGGMPDMIEHQVNGYLAAPFEADDIAVGIKQAVTTIYTQRDEISQSTHEKFSNSKIGNAYLDVYHHLMLRKD